MTYVPYFGQKFKGEDEHKEPLRGETFEEYAERMRRAESEKEEEEGGR